MSWIHPLLAPVPESQVTNEERPVEIYGRKYAGVTRAARSLGVSRTTIRNRIKAGQGRYLERRNDL